MHCLPDSLVSQHQRLQLYAEPQIISNQYQLLHPILTCSVNSQDTNTHLLLFPITMKRWASFPSFWFNHSKNTDTYCHVNFYIYWGSCKLNYVVHFTDVQFWTIHCCYHNMLFSDRAQVFTSKPYRTRLMLSITWPNCNSRPKHTK